MTGASRDYTTRRSVHNGPLLIVSPLCMRYKRSKFLIGESKMLNASTWFNALRVASGARSDYQLAKYLGITQQAVSGYATGRRTFSSDVALKAADYIQIPPRLALIACRFWQATDEAEKVLWVSTYYDLGGAQVDDIVDKLAHHREAA